MGRIADFDRFEAFFDSLVVLNATIGIRRDFRTVSIDARAGPSVFHSTATIDYPDRKDETLIDYAVHVWATSQRPLEFGASVSGRISTADVDASFSERHINQFTMAVAWRNAYVRPVAFFRFPLDDDLGTALNYALGLALTVPLRLP